MNRSKNQILTLACALLLAQLSWWSAEVEAQQESPATLAESKPIPPDLISHGAALTDLNVESFAVRQPAPLSKTPGHGAGSEAGGPGCGDGACDAGENACNCSDDCPGVCPCVLFDNEAEFVAFAAGAGTALPPGETACRSSPWA